MSERKSRVDVEFYLDLFANVLRDAYACFPEIPQREYERDLKTVRTRVYNEGIAFLTRNLPALGKAVDRALETGSLEIPPGFGPKTKAGKSRGVPKLFSALFAVTFDCTGTLRSVEKTSVGVIRQLCYLCYKIKIPFTPQDEAKASEKFKEIDCSLPHEFEEERTAFKYARLLLKRLFAGFDPASVTPRHGPGAVAERLMGRSKYENTFYDPVIDQLYPYVHYVTFGIHRQTCESLLEHTALPREKSPSRVCFVPKDSRGPRTIAAEPALLQYLQQGLGRAVVDWVERHPLSRGRVLFSSQQTHRLLAMRSSVNQKYATLDMKDASDRVSVSLVARLFPEHMLPYLMALRSPAAHLPNGEVVVLNKFASMGSALCFPIEALTFWALASGALWSKNRDRVGVRQRVYVFGDDIIVPTTYADDVVTELERYGVLFNRDKCYVRGLFRESCGMDSFNGEDVTPIRVKELVLAARNCRYSNLVSLNENANAFFDRGYWRTARYLDDYVERWWGPIPTTVRTFNGLSRRSSVLPMRTFIPSGVKVRWNRALQRREVRTLKLKAREVRSTFPSEVRRLGHNLLRGVPEPYDDSVAVPHSALPKVRWENVA